MGNSYALVAQESSYDTAPASGYRDLQVNADGVKAREPFIVQRAGMRRNAAAPRAAGRRTILNGAEGPIDVDAISNGLGIILRTAASSSTVTAVPDTTGVHEHVFEFTHLGPPAGRSVTMEWYRDQEDGDYDWYQYRGGRCKQLDYGVSLDELLNFKFDMDFGSFSRLTSNPSRTPVTVDPDFVASWADPTITLTPIGGSDVIEELQSASGTIPTGIDTDRRRLRKGATRKEPIRNTLVEPSGSLSWKYQTSTYFDAFVDGEHFTLSNLFEGDNELDDGVVPSIEIVHHCIAFAAPNDPQAAVNETTMQDFPFVVLDDETNPHTTVTIVTSDDAL